MHVLWPPVHSPHLVCFYILHHHARETRWGWMDNRGGLRCSVEEALRQKQSFTPRKYYCDSVTKVDHGTSTKPSAEDGVVPTLILTISKNLEG